MKNTTTHSRPEARVEPMDEHNEKLVANVRPPGWVAPDPASRYHLVVVGGGTGGLVSAAIAAGLGARVALVERHLMGGDCLNVGCVPSKAVIRAARAWTAARDARERFAGPPVSGEGDFASVMERMRRLRAGISRHDSAARFRDLGVDVFLGDGRFVGPDALEVQGNRLRFRRAVIATGGRPATLPVAGLEETGFRTNESIFELTALPARLAVIGAGPIGCELSQAFARLGSRVTVLDSAGHVLPRENEDAARVVQASLLRDGVTYEPNVRVVAAERRGEEKALRWEREGQQGETVADEVLVAAGRTPNVDLGLDAAGVRFDERQGVHVDDYLRTSNRRIFAVGDVSSKHKFTHMADAQARLVVRNALFFGPALAALLPWKAKSHRASSLHVPWCTYTSPEVAHVGYSEKEAEEAGLRPVRIRVDLSEVDRAVLDGEEEGFLEVVATPSGRIIGGTLVAEHAGEMAGELALAVRKRLTLPDLSDTVHPYPTQAEILRKAGDAWNRRKLTPGARKAFAAFFRLVR